MTERQYRKLERLLKAALDDTPDHQTEQVYYLQWAIELAQDRQDQ